VIAARRRREQAASSYLEVMLAMVILTICIVPAGRMLPTVLAGQRGLQTRFQLGLIAQEKLEAAVLELGDDFSARDDTGDLAVQGHDDWHYHLAVTIPPAGGGRYALALSQAWADENGNATPDADEPQVRFDTLVANPQWSP